MIEIELKNLLETEGTSASDRIYPLTLPETTTFPALTYQRVINVGHHDIDVSYPHIQITAWAPMLIDARGLAAEVEAILKRYKGVLNGHHIKQIVKESSPGDIHDREAGEYGLVYIPVDYKVIYEVR